MPVENSVEFENNVLNIRNTAAVCNLELRKKLNFFGEKALGLF